MNQLNWILLIGDEKFNLDVIKAIKHPDSIRCYDVNEIKNRYCVDFGTDHIFYDYDETGSILRDYERKDLKKIPFKNPHIIIMTYTSEERLRNILQHSIFPKGIYVDNDFGLIIPMEEYVRLGMPTR